MSPSAVKWKKLILQCCLCSLLCFLSFVLLLTSLPGFVYSAYYLCLLESGDVCVCVCVLESGDVCVCVCTRVWGCVFMTEKLINEVVCVRGSDILGVDDTAGYSAYSGSYHCII